MHGLQTTAEILGTGVTISGMQVDNNKSLSLHHCEQVLNTIPSHAEKFYKDPSYVYCKNSMFKMWRA
jgi:hypothetical protein